MKSFREPQFEGLLKLLRDSDAAVANLNSDGVSVLLGNGVRLTNALNLVAGAFAGEGGEGEWTRVRERVRQGSRLGEALADTPEISPVAVRMLRIGEETGDVPGALENIANTYENELGISLRVLMNLIEPVMIVVMAVGVGFLLFSVLSAMFTITSNIGMSRQ